MRKIIYLILCVFCAGSLMAQNVWLRKEGIEIDGGAMGNFMLLYPTFRVNSTGDPVKPEPKVKSDQEAEILYPGDRNPKLQLKVAENKVMATVVSTDPGCFDFEMFIPIIFAGQGEFFFMDENDRKLLPKDKPERPHLAQLHAERFTLLDRRSDSRIGLRFAPGNFMQLTDNREWNWKIFRFLSIVDVHDNRTGHFEIEVTTEKPEKVKVRVDPFGQPKEFDFPGKIRSEEELKADVASDRAYYDALRPSAVAPWGGMPGSKEKYNLKATGFFRLDKVEGRDVLVTPDGDIFFQLSVCNLNPGDDYTYIKGREQIYEFLPPYESAYKTAYRASWATDFSYYVANCIRKYGQPYALDQWKPRQIERLRKWGFNSEGAFTARTKVNEQLKFPRTPELYRIPGIAADICDPFDPAARAELDQHYKAMLLPDADDPGIIGYFIANEQPYPELVRQFPGFDGKVAAKRELINFLKKKYTTVDAFNRTWGMKASSFEELVEPPLPVQTQAAWDDMDEYAAYFFEEYFKLVHETFRKYDKNHMLIGSRFMPSHIGVEGAVKACARYCDIFSINYYTRNIDPEFLTKVNRLTGRPILLSEWSYGTSEQGLSGGVIDVRNQTERGEAYRSYVEQSAALPFVVGHQWFSMIDQALTGRFFQHFNGESMNIGLLNVADRPYKDFLAEVMKTNYRIYDLVLGKEEPFARRLEAAGKRDPKSVQVPRSLPGHKVDGVRSPWPGRPSERLDKSNLVMGSDDGGISADFWLCFDDSHLYLFAEVTDPTPAQNQFAGSDMWQGDCVELFIGTEFEKEGALLFTDRQILISAKPGAGMFFVNQKEQPEGSVTVIPNQKGYSLEGAIPWSALSITPEKGMKFRFDLALDNNDGGPRRLQQFIWSGSATNSSDRTNWGIATLVD